MNAVIVVPCYNEELRFNATAFAQFASAQPAIRFLFVDDGSKDGTAALLQHFCQTTPTQFEFLGLPQNVGKAEAVRQGMLHASQPAGEAPAPDLIGFWDADLATPLAAIPEFLQVFATRPTIDMVFGSRVKLLGRAVKRKTTRHYLGRIFATVAATMLGLSIYDTQCGAKIFRNTAEFRQLLAEPFHSRWIFDVEIIARYLKNRRQPGSVPIDESIYELPLHAWEDVPGSKLKSHHFLIAARDLWSIKRRYR